MFKLAKDGHCSALVKEINVGGELSREKSCMISILAFCGQASVIWRCLMSEPFSSRLASHPMSLQVTWSDFRTLLRIMKTYRFQLKLSEPRLLFGAKSKQHQLFSEDANGPFAVRSAEFAGSLFLN